ncbi:hypothetical protein ACHAXT_006679 [Thalassiosira profunda]
MAFVLDKTLLVSGSLQIFVACFSGLFGGVARNYRAFFGSHHQFMHNAEVLLTLAVIAPLLPMSATRRKIFDISIQLATWSNPLAYLVAGFSGTAWNGSPRDAPEVSREFTTASYFSLALVPVICAPACFVAFGILLASALALPGSKEKAEEKKQ